MKVVLFCGGLGTRLREHADTIPKPLVNIGYRPILWHLMKYYAHFGHKDFVLCLGYRGDQIRDFFLNYNEALSTDFVWSDGGRSIELLDEDISDWRVTMVDTGLHSNIGQRLMAVRQYVEDEPMFLANYSDGLSDFPLNAYINDFEASDAVASFMSSRTGSSFHAIHADDNGKVTRIGQLDESELWINAGYFVLRPQVFDYIEEGEELVEQPFRRLVEQGKLTTHKHPGFWRPMDTLKDKIEYDRMYARGQAPWQVWKAE